MQWTSKPDKAGWCMEVDPSEGTVSIGPSHDHIGDEWGSVRLNQDERLNAAVFLAGSDHVVVPRAELVALYGDAPVDVPVIRRILGETK